MRNLLTIFLILSFISCNQEIRKSESNIRKFEHNIGAKELDYLNEIINDFDNFLANNYPDKKSKFKAYLADISELKTIKYWKIDSTKMHKYRKSNLFAKYETIYPDTVWYDGQTFSIKFPNTEYIEEIIPIRRKNVDLNIDSTINSLKHKPETWLIEQSDFYLALNSIQKSDSLIITYLEVKEIAGNLSPTILASGIMYYLTDKNEYFAKRIFVMDIHDY